MSYTNQLKNDLDKIKNDRKESVKNKKRKPYSNNKIRPYFPDIKILKEDLDFSYADIAIWLDKNKGIKITRDGLRKSYTSLLDAEKENGKKLT